MTGVEWACGRCGDLVETAGAMPAGWEPYDPRDRSSAWCGECVAQLLAQLQVELRRFFSRPPARPARCLAHTVPSSPDARCTCQLPVGFRE